MIRRIGEIKTELEILEVAEARSEQISSRILDIEVGLRSTKYLLSMKKM